VRPRRSRDRPGHRLLPAEGSRDRRDPAPLRPGHEGADDLLRDGQRCSGLRRRRVPPHALGDLRSRRRAHAVEPLAADGETVTWKRAVVASLAALTVLVGARDARPAQPPALLCKLPLHSTQTLPPTARHGLIHHLLQYPSVSLATPRQKARAETILARL